jgi:dipeptidyl aminopeptidase/acylaminoacyl peptidase
VTDRAFIGYPAWSPDGASIAYSRDRQGATATEIVRHHLGSGRQDIIVGPQPGLPEITMAAWSPNGRQLVFALINTVPDASGTLGQIITIDSDGANQRVLVSSREHRLAFPCWSPTAC